MSNFDSPFSIASSFLDSRREQLYEADAQKALCEKRMKETRDASARQKKYDHSRLFPSAEKSHMKMGTCHQPETNKSRRCGN